MPARQSYYEVLGLDAPPKDRKAVKLAYSKKLKVTRPEDDPDGFMRLRDAHDIALNVVARQAEQAAWEAQQVPDAQVQETPAQETPAQADPGMTYEDMIPAKTETPEDTSYSIGPTPVVHAPVTYPDGPHYEPEAPKTPPLIDELHSLLSDERNYNDRENWNRLFRNARQLDIDDYVDFERLLMEAILEFHGYYGQREHYNTPEKMPQKFFPSITASLFKTMSWDQVHTQGYTRNNQVQWLSRRMRVHRTRRDAVPLPLPENTKPSGSKVWAWIISIFAVLKLIHLLANL